MSGYKNFHNYKYGEWQMIDLQAVGWYVVSAVKTKPCNTNNTYETFAFLLPLQCAVFTSGNAAWFMPMKKCMINTIIINHQYNVVSVSMPYTAGFLF